jgi:hypothetical protein
MRPGARRFSDGPPHLADTQPRIPGERPSISWLVEPPVSDAAFAPSEDPTALVAVGESDRRLTHGPAARPLPLPRDNARSTQPV